MSITIAFVAVIAAVIVGGSLHRWWDRSRNLCFGDEAGSTTSTFAFARFEARQVLTHPTWIITLVFCLALTGLLIALEASSGADGTDDVVTWFAIIGFPLAGLALIVSTHRIGTRSRRDHTDELVAATPTAPRARTAGLLIACLAPLPVFIAGIALVTAATQLTNPYAARPTISNVVPFVAFVLPGLGGAVVGVLLSRWMPFAVAPLLGIVAIIWLNNGPDHLHPRFRWLRVGVEGSYGGRFDIRPEGLLLVFIGGLVALGACLALWRHPARPLLVGATAASLVVVSGTGWVMTRPPSRDQVAAVVDQLENPAAHQVCATRASVTYCVYRGAERWIDTWAPAIDGVIAQIPRSKRPGVIVVEQRPLVETREYLAEVQASLDPEMVWRDDGRIHPPMDINGDRAGLLVGWQAAAIVVGLPPAPDWEHPSGCIAGGQARLVLAHVLTARATTITQEAFRVNVDWVVGEGLELAPFPIEIAGEYDVDTSQGEGSELEPGDRLAADGVTAVDHLTPVGATGWGSDTLAADALLRADRAKVDQAISDHWDELVDASTPTSRFLELAGVEPMAERIPMTATTEAAACP